LGKRIVSFAGLILCVLVPTGLILFWRARRTTIKWSASWFRICFDTHHVVGIYGSLFLPNRGIHGNPDRIWEWGARHLRGHAIQPAGVYIPGRVCTAGGG
jgi:PepSY-associated TM region